MTERKRSKLYFTLQQICRIFEKTLEETLVNLRQREEEFIGGWDGWQHTRKKTEVDDDLDILNKHWTEAMSASKKRLEWILTRVKDKRAEVESLWDGVCKSRIKNELR